MKKKLIVLFIVSICVFSITWVTASELKLNSVIKSSSSWQNSFSSSQGLEDLERSFKETEVFFRRKDREKYFRNLKIDHENNFQTVLKILSKHYLIPLDNQQIRKKVLALRFLKWTGKWKNGQQCVSVLAAIEKLYLGTSDKQLQINLMSDLGDLAAICSNIDFKQLSKFYDSRKNNSIKAQIDLGARITQRIFKKSKDNFNRSASL